MPILFGFYGVFSLFSQFQKTQALLYLFQVAVILYPPLRLQYLSCPFCPEKRRRSFKRLFVEKGGLRIKMALSKK